MVERQAWTAADPIVVHVRTAQHAGTPSIARVFRVRPMKVNFDVQRSCDDNIANGTESDVDCGGADCEPCQDGSTCLDNADCSSGQCIGQTCVSCEDDLRNGAETDIDCGGDICGPCEVNSRCIRPGFGLLERAMPRRHMCPRELL